MMDVYMCTHKKTCTCMCTCIIHVCVGEVLYGTVCCTCGRFKMKALPFWCEEKERGRV